MILLECKVSKSRVYYTYTYTQGRREKQVGDTWAFRKRKKENNATRKCKMDIRKKTERYKRARGGVVKAASR